MLSTNAENLLKQRYYLPGETFEQLCNRIVSAYTKGESSQYQEYVFHAISNLEFLPNSPAIVNAGKNRGSFACFVAGPTEDTLENHLDTLKSIAQVAKAGGGCGFTGTFIRPKNSPVNGSVHGYSYGPNAWAKNVSNYMDMMTQSGFRKMALMYTLNSEHADLEDFIQLKQSGNEKELYNFNQSIFATDNWLNNATTKPFSNEARLFNKLVENSWNNGEPGLLFDDTINSPELPYMLSGQRISATNPCGLYYN